MDYRHALISLLELATKYLGPRGVKHYLKEHGDESVIEFYEKEVLNK